VYGMILYVWGHPEFREAWQLLAGRFARKRSESAGDTSPRRQDRS